MLGIKQSGHIDTIGMSLYMSMLKTALKNEYSESQKSCEIKLTITSLIPEDYLPSPVERLKIYKSLSAADLKSLTNIKYDLLDKCGRHPQELINLFKVTELAIKAKEIDIKKITQASKFLKFKFSENITEDTLNKIMIKNKDNPEIYQIKNNGELWINYVGKDVLNLLNDVIDDFS